MRLRRARRSPAAPWPSPTLLHVLGAHVLQHLGGFLLAERQQQDRGALGAADGLCRLALWLIHRRLTHVFTTCATRVGSCATSRARLRDLLLVGDGAAAGGGVGACAAPPALRRRDRVRADAAQWPGRVRRPARRQQSAGAPAASARTNTSTSARPGRRRSWPGRAPRPLPDRQRIAARRRPRHRLAEERGVHDVDAVAARLRRSPTASLTSARDVARSARARSGDSVTLPSLPRRAGCRPAPPPTGGVSAAGRLPRVGHRPVDFVVARAAACELFGPAAATRRRRAIGVRAGALAPCAPRRGSTGRQRDAGLGGWLVSAPGTPSAPAPLPRGLLGQLFAAHDLALGPVLLAGFLAWRSCRTATATCARTRPAPTSGVSSCLDALRRRPPPVGARTRTARRASRASSRPAATTAAGPAGRRPSPVRLEFRDARGHEVDDGRHLLARQRRPGLQLQEHRGAAGDAGR